MKIERCVCNPLLTPADVKPSRQDFKIDGVFNCGVTEYKGEVILLCRVGFEVLTALIALLMASVLSAMSLASFCSSLV